MLLQMCSRWLGDASTLFLEAWRRFRGSTVSRTVLFRITDERNGAASV